MAPHSPHPSADDVETRTSSASRATCVPNVVRNGVTSGNATLRSSTASITRSTVGALPTAGNHPRTVPRSGHTGVMSEDPTSEPPADAEATPTIPTTPSPPTPPALIEFMAGDWEPIAPVVERPSPAAPFHRRRREILAARFADEWLVVPTGGLKV